VQHFFNQKSWPLLTPSHTCFWSANDGYSIISFSGLKTSRSALPRQPGAGLLAARRSRQSAAGSGTRPPDRALIRDLAGAISAVRGDVLERLVAGVECPLMAISRHSDRCVRESALPSKADIQIMIPGQAPANVRFAPKSRHWRGYR
jgi:hypothetical protein